MPSYIIKSVEIVEGKKLVPYWKNDMQLIQTDKGCFIDKLVCNNGHDWNSEIKKEVSAIEKSDKFCKYKWLCFSSEKKTTEVIEGTNKNIKFNDTLPENYDINENPELAKTYDYIKQNEPAIFLTGGAGTGKSTFIKYLNNNLKKELNKNCVILAPTGVAAVNVGGQTIHSFFKFKTDVFEDSEIKISNKNSVLDHIDLIIIDEISMVASWMLDHIDYALRLWCDKTKPFGGKQMLLIGDCFQLPPIADNDSAKQKYFERWNSPFFFAAKVFNNICVKAIQLKNIYRQKDENFVHMLNRIRKCQRGYEKDIELLNDKCFIQTRLGTPNIPEECLLLTTKNDDAEIFNIKKMSILKNKGAEFMSFKGLVEGNFNFEHFLTPQTLELCIDAKIMVTKNIPSQNLYNGNIGRVVSFGKNYIEVNVDGKLYKIERQTWQSIRYKWDDKEKVIKQVQEGSFSQFPLMLGWAVTIHKSQGLTLDAVAIDAADAWDSGQIYVALSRAKTLSGIFLRKQIPVFAVKSNEYIKKVYSELFPETQSEDLYNPNYEINIQLDNSGFTIEKNEEITTVNIGGIEFELFPKENEKIQDNVRKILPILLKYKLIPEDEMGRLLFDRDYCYETFGIISPTNYKYTLLSEDKESFYDSFFKQYKCWTKSYYGYYICSQWYQNLSLKFANWLIKLSKNPNIKFISTKVEEVIEDDMNTNSLHKKEIDKLLRDLRTVGFSTFVKYYKYYNNPSLKTCDIRKIIEENEEYSSNSIATKASTGKSICNRGDGEKALKIISEANNSDSETIKSAEELLNLNKTKVRLIKKKDLKND